MKRVCRAFLYALRRSPLNKGKAWWLALVFGVGAFRCSEQVFTHMLEIDMRTSIARDLGRRLSPDRYYYAETALWFSGVVLLGGLAIWFAARYWHEEQRRRNELAEDIRRKAVEAFVQKIADGKPVPPFVLYLRPFIYIGRFRMGRIGPPPISVSFYTKPARDEFDDYLRSCLKQDAEVSLICLGNEDGQLGAGRIKTEDERWWTDFTMLAQYAVGIAIVPGIQKGIAREISWLRTTGLLNKTLFLKPRGYSPADWEAVRRFYDDAEGFDLPEWSPKLLTFRLYASGRSHDIHHWVWTFMKQRGEKQMANALRSEENEPHSPH